MLTAGALKKLVAMGEGLTLEFKKKVNHPQRIVNELVAMANTSGGYILIGVADNGNLSGLKYADDDMEYIINYLRQRIDPPISFTNGITPISKHLGIIWIKIPAPAAQVYAVRRGRAGNGTIYYRLKDESIKVSPEFKRILQHGVKQRGRTIRFGEIESAVLKSLEQYPPLSINKLVELHGFRRREIANCMVNLVLAKVLKIIPGKPDDLFTFDDNR
jgi:hypothetical protein